MPGPPSVMTRSGAWPGVEEGIRWHSAAAGAIAQATASTGSRVVALVVFTVVASVGVAAPLIVYVSMGERAAAMLSSMQTWMVRNNAAIMAVLLLVLGTKLVGDGVSAL